MAREPNLGEEFVEALGSSLELEFVAGGSGNLHESFGPDDVFNYIYAVLHSPQYRHRYADFLKSRLSAGADYQRPVSVCCSRGPWETPSFPAPDGIEG